MKDISLYFQIIKDVEVVSSQKGLVCRCCYPIEDDVIKFEFKQTGMYDDFCTVYLYPNDPYVRNLPVDAKVKKIVEEALKYFNKHKEATNMNPTEYFKMEAELAKKMVNSVYDSHFRKTLSIKKVIFNPPATVIFWDDGTKTVVKAQDGECFDPEKGMAIAIAKKALGNKHDYYDKIKKWTKKYERSSDSK